MLSENCANKAQMECPCFTLKELGFISLCSQRWLRSAVASFPQRGSQSWKKFFPPKRGRGAEVKKIETFLSRIRVKLAVFSLKFPTFWNFWSKKGGGGLAKGLQMMDPKERLPVAQQKMSTELSTKNVWCTIIRVCITIRAYTVDMISLQFNATIIFIWFWRKLFNLFRYVQLFLHLWYVICIPYLQQICTNIHVKNNKQWFNITNVQTMNIYLKQRTQKTKVPLINCVCIPPAWKVINCLPYLFPCV